MQLLRAAGAERTSWGKTLGQRQLLIERAGFFLLLSIKTGFSVVLCHSCTHRGVTQIMSEWTVPATLLHLAAQNSQSRLHVHTQLCCERVRLIFNRRRVCVSLSDNQDDRRQCRRGVGGGGGGRRRCHH